ncbi:MAG: hypothetical protein ACQEP7_04295 [bacterium]
MARKDMELNRAVERALVRQDVNTRKLKWRTTGARISFKGKITKLHGHDVEDQDELKRLDKRLKRLDGVHTVEWDLENWKKEHGKWKKKKKDDSGSSGFDMGRGSNVQLDW